MGILFCGLFFLQMSSTHTAVERRDLELSRLTRIGSFRLEIVVIHKDTQFCEAVIAKKWRSAYKKIDRAAGNHPGRARGSYLATRNVLQFRILTFKQLGEGHWQWHITLQKQQTD